MKILLDTHVIIWTLTDDPRLSPEARDMILNPDNMICVSSASMWEIAIKNQKAPEKCPYQEIEIAEICLESGFEIIDIELSHILAIRDLQVRAGRKLSNMDPFDRILIAQAKTENCRLLSHDTNFENYAEKCIVRI